MWIDPVVFGLRSRNFRQMRSQSPFISLHPEFFQVKSEGSGIHGKPGTGSGAEAAECEAGADGPAAGNGMILLIRFPKESRKSPLIPTNPRFSVRDLLETGLPALIEKKKNVIKSPVFVRKPDKIGAADQIRTGDLILTNGLESVKPLLYSAFPAFLVQKDEVNRAALSAGSTGCFSRVGRQVGQGTIQQAAPIKLVILWLRSCGRNPADIPDP